MVRKERDVGRIVINKATSDRDDTQTRERGLLTQKR